MGMLVVVCRRERRCAGGRTVERGHASDATELERSLLKVTAVVVVMTRFELGMYTCHPF